MIVDDEGWMSLSPGQDPADFIREVAAARPPLTDSEIVTIRAIFNGTEPARTLQAA
ncbi:hypothetical protein P3T35_003022 [Kitasatospora sp. GP30]|uniref:hypothetical protein n=1 Tax=Kitasatospora sp. GP30 TaxID=3035084 RepID=UPI000CBCAC58|nr:hypothetical protein [Kitasatospora sp. GP30]MDH6141009.1 hypothetical protein [Kitasatospora sp. GP30]